MSQETEPSSNNRDQRSQIDRRTALKGAGALAVLAAPFQRQAQAQDSEGANLKPSIAPRLAPGEKTLTLRVAEYSAQTSIDKIPAEVKERARKVIFDEMACAYFGRRSDGGAMAAKYVALTGGAPEAAVYGTNQRAPAAFAAMANGTAGHGDEVDGTHVVGGHPGASIVHACAAMAARQGASGAELLNAVVLGYDIGARLVEACGGKFVVRDQKHLTSDFLYALGCTASASRILQLDPVRQCHALALSTFQTNGLYALYSERRHISKSFCNGQYAYAGISSALMAQVGLEGNEDIIGSQEGLIDAWGDGKHSEAITLGLGAEFKIMGGNFKFYNAGYPIHTPIEATMNLVRQHHITNDSIQSVLIGMPENAMKVVDNREMHNICVQDMVAANLATGGLKLVDRPFPAILDNPMYKRLRSSINVQVDPELQRQFPDGRGARVTIRLKNGTMHSLRIDNPLGHSLRGEPGWNDLWNKWQGSLTGCDAEKAFSLAQKLDTLSHAGDLFSAFSGINA